MGKTKAGAAAFGKDLMEGDEKAAEIMSKMKADVAVEMKGNPEVVKFVLDLAQEASQRNLF